MKEKLNKKGNNMKLSELGFEPNYSDDSLNLELVNEFFETNNKPTTNGRTYNGNTGGHSERYPHRFGLMEKVHDHTYWEGERTGNGFYDDNKLLGWPTDCRRDEYSNGWTPRGSYLYETN